MYDNVGVGLSVVNTGGFTTNNEDSPYTSTEGQWLARNIILGFLAAPIEGLPEVSVTDVVSEGPGKKHCVFLT